MFTAPPPEVLFEDYGTAQLVNGTVTVTVDATFARNIFVDDKHPLKVFIQLEGDCKGVYVTNKSKNSFTVKELASGNSSVAFSWHIIGNRIDESATNGEKIIYQSLRYPDAPGPLASPELKVTQVKKVEDDVHQENTTTTNIPN